MPIIYIIHMIGPCQAGAKNAGIIRAYIGNLAPQLNSGITIIVVRRVRRFSRIRVAIIAGTEQPKPINIGMKLLPCKPILCITRSIRNAARAM
jgi:hypothetical protein